MAGVVARILISAAVVRAEVADRRCERGGITPRPALISPTVRRFRVRCGPRTCFGVERNFAMRMRFLVFWGAMVAGLSAQAPQRVLAPHFWNDRELSDWATPIVGLN